ncbi:MAG: hypothetical protein QW717_06300 [Candidatus Bathyarchaeia archaeon]
MNFPMSLADVSLWLAVMAIITLIASEVVCNATGLSGNILIEKRRLRLAGLALGLGFMVTVVMRVFQPF